MRLRIILLVVAISSLVLVSFLVPLALLLRTSAADQAKSTATIQTQWMVPLVATLDGPSLKLAVARVNAQNKSQPVTVFMPGGQALGPPAPRSPAVQLAANGRSFAANVRGGVEVLVAVQGLPHGTAVIRTFVPDSKLTHGVLHAWIVLGSIGLGLLGLSVIVSALLARSLVRPLRALAHASETLAAGDLSARAPIEGAPEIRQVSTGLNRLAVRIGELLAHERETVADLSHRLRTPLTALRIDAESLRDDEEMARVINDVDGLTRTVNEIIREARRPTDEGGTTCDAADIVRSRAAFWRALAEDQERHMTVDVPAGHLPVRASARDVAACVDILLENVFAHTPEGAAFTIRVSTRAAGGAWLVVTDEGPGFSDPDPTLRGMSSGGSTGLGLDIARRIAETSGGTLMLGHSPQGGGAVTVGLGPAASTAKQERRLIRPRPYLHTRSRRAEDARLAAELAEWAAISGPDLNSR
jgi:signal transduction histidine kinase